MSKFTDMEVFVGTRTAKAVQLTFFPDTDDETILWVPFSVLEDPDRVDEVDDDGKVDISIATWYLQKNDIEYDPGEDEDAGHLTHGATFPKWGDM